MGRSWTTKELELLQKMFPDNYTKELVPIFKRSYSAISSCANKLGFKKSPTFMTIEFERQAMRLKEQGRKYWFSKGNVSHNKGLKQTEFLSSEGIAASAKTRFKKGNMPHNVKYDGYERINKDGYVEVRISKGKFKLKHRHIWEQAKGPIQDDCVLRFIDGDKRNFELSNLEIITKIENALRNHKAYKIPKELMPKVVDYIKIKKQIKAVIHS